MTHGGPDTRRLDLIQLPARRPADLPPVAPARTEGQPQASGQGPWSLAGTRAATEHQARCGV